MGVATRNAGVEHFDQFRVSDVCDANHVRFIDSAQRFGTILPGAPIVTSGGSLSLAPPDIVVGTVSKVTDRLGTAGPILEINLVADLTNLSFVRILLYQPITEQVKP